jgi:hypothetical protein
MGMAIYGAVGLGLPSFLSSVAGGYILQTRGFITLFLTYAAVPLMGIVVLAAWGRKLLPLFPAAAHREDGFSELLIQRQGYCAIEG